MRDIRHRAEYYLACLEHPGDAAALSLVYAGVAVLPYIVEAFHHEKRPRRRSALVYVAWQCRTDEALPLLLEALHDPEAEVWKESLDGFVALGTPAALAALQVARAETAWGRRAREIREWIDEAIRQIEHGYYR